MCIFQKYIFEELIGPKLGRLPRFTFSPFTRDPNLQQTKFTRDPNLHISKFTQDPNLHETKFTHDPNLHENLHKTRFTQTQIYTKPIFTRSQIYTNPNLHINRNSKEGQTYDIFLKSPWYEDLKNNSPECLACKYTNTALIKDPQLKHDRSWWTLMTKLNSRSPFCSKLGPLFRIFGSPFDCVTVHCVI